MWLEVSLTVDDGELAEAVADVLARYLPEGVFIQATGVVFDPDSEGRGIGPYRVCGYIPQDENLESTRAKIEQGIWHLSQIQPLPEIQTARIPETNWVESWKQHYRPIPVGKRLAIVPAWEENPEADRVMIRIDPGMAFGTGTHPTTQLTLELLEQAFDEGRPEIVIDVGCGSGILSIAAVLLGAGRAYGVDLDPDAIENARQNASLNGVVENTEFGIGSVQDLLAQAPLRTGRVVMANILAHVLIELLDAGLGALVAPGGLLLLSGILEEREAGVREAASRQGFRVVDRRQMGDWVALAVRK